MSAIPFGQSIIDPPSDSPALPPAGSGPDRLRASFDEIKRGVKPGTKRGPYKRSETSPAKAEPVQAPAKTQIFTEANTGRLLRTPFTIAAIRTQCAVWVLTPEEEKELVASAVPCLNEWVSIEPKWVAAGMFAYSLGSLGLSKALGYMAFKEAMRLQDKESAPKPADKKPTQPSKAEPVGGFPPDQQARLDALKPTERPPQ